MNNVCVISLCCSGEIWNSRVSMSLSLVSMSGYNRCLLKKLLPYSAIVVLRLTFYQELVIILSGTDKKHRIDVILEHYLYLIKLILPE